MNAPLVWIVLPGVYAAILFLMRRWGRAVVVMGILVSILLAWLAWTEPIGETLILGSLRIKLDDTLFVLGRRFVLRPSDAPVLTMIYLGAAFWFGGATVARAGSFFVPIGLAIAALLTAAIAVEPFLYAALLIELVTIISIPLISPLGRPVGRGVLRYLTFQTLAMPLILFTGWILAGVEASPADSSLVLHGNILLALGFAFLLAIFPFHTWVPMLAAESHPFVAAFIFYILSLGITFLGIGFLERYLWLRTSSNSYALLQFVGMLMVVLGGLWAAFQVHLGRILGYAVLMETGLSLLTVSIGPAGELLPPSLEILFSSMLPRGLAFGIWALALTTLAAYGDGDGEGETEERLSFDRMRGKGRKFPIAVGLLMMANLSLAGFPLLAGFPVRLALWNALAQKSVLAAVVALLGSVGLLTGCLRSLAILTAGGDEVPWTMTEQWSERIMFFLGGLALLLVGILPQWFLPALGRMTQIYLSSHP